MKMRTVLVPQFCLQSVHSLVRERRLEHNKMVKFIGSIVQWTVWKISAIGIPRYRESCGLDLSLFIWSFHAPGSVLGTVVLAIKRCSTSLQECRRVLKYGYRLVKWKGDEGIPGKQNHGTRSHIWKWMSEMDLENSPAGEFIVETGKRCVYKRSESYWRSSP